MNAPLIFSEQHSVNSHYDDVIMGAMASQITSLTIVYSTIYPDADQRKHQSSASLAFVLGIHRGSVNSLHTWPVTRKKCFHFITSSCSSTFLLPRMLRRLTFRTYFNTIDVRLNSNVFKVFKQCSCWKMCPFDWLIFAQFILCYLENSDYSAN